MMNLVYSLPRVATTILAVLSMAAGLAAAPTIEPDLTGIPSERGWKLINRAAVVLPDHGGRAVRLQGEDGTGFVRLLGVDFTNGTIEFDARGRNVVQQSFLGVAFHGAGVATYDAIYFRPFNFRPADPVRRQRAVQYVSHPKHTWHTLRSQSPGKYEAAAVPAPDPDGWFHVRIVVSAPAISVFIDRATEPCLVVEQLSDRKHGWLGLWTDVKGGDFANLRIAPATD